MPEAIPIDQLEVIGYADSLEPGMLPSIVPPVFRFRAQRDRALLPPYTLNSGFLYGASEVEYVRIQELYEADEIVLFENPFLAKAGFELWIDESTESRYETRSSARSSLQRLANQSIQLAKTAFENGNLAESERFCSSAIAADDKCLDAFVIKAAIRRRENDSAGERLMADLVSPYLNRLSFEKLVDVYAQADGQFSPTVPEAPTIPPMRAMATYRAAA